MNICATQFDLEHVALEIYFSGCNFRCKNCQNSELWDFNVGTPWKEFIIKNKLWEKINNTGKLVQSVVFLGGEPMHQNVTEMTKFCNELEKNCPKQTKVLFTGYEFSEIPEFFKKYFDLFKCGQYLEEQKSQKETCFGYTLASENQYFCVNCETTNEYNSIRRLNLVMKEPSLLL